MIVIEDQKVSNMSKSAKGTTERHGRNVKAKSGLKPQYWSRAGMKCAVSLSTSSSGEVVRYWQYPRLHQRQKCACCGHTAKENRQSQSQFECLECGYTANADINRARNILAAGHAVLACGGRVQSDRPSKQEPAEAIQ